MESDSRYSHDPYSEAPVHPESRFRTAYSHDDDGNRSSHDNPVHAVRHVARICRTASELFPLFDSLHPALYATGYKPEKSLCPPLRRAALKEVKS